MGKEEKGKKEWSNGVVEGFVVDIGRRRGKERETSWMKIVVGNLVITGGELVMVMVIVMVVIGLVLEPAPALEGNEPEHRRCREGKCRPALKSDKTLGAGEEGRGSL